MKKSRQLKSMNVAFVGEETSVKEIESVPIVKQIIYDEAVASITEAIDKNQDHSSLFEINNSGFILELRREDWIRSLTKAKSYYEEDENYEKCAHINYL